MSKKIGFSVIQPISEKPVDVKLDSKNTTTTQSSNKISAYEAHADFIAHYKAKKQASIKNFKEKFPNGATITEGNFLKIK